MLTTCVRRGALLAAVLLTALGTSLAAAVGPAAAADPDPISLDPSALPQGPAPAIPYFDPVAKLLHDGGKTLDLTTLKGVVIQLHKVDGGYLLGRRTSPTGNDLVFLSATGRRTLVSQQWKPPGTCDCLQSDVLVDSSGGSVTFNRRPASGFYKDTVSVSLPALKTIRTRVFTSAPTLFEQRGGKALLQLDIRLIRWAPKTNATATIPSSQSGPTAVDSSAHQLAFRGDGSGDQTVGPLPPATGPRWSLDTDENIGPWSPDDQHIAGADEIVNGGTDTGFIVHRASDGQIALMVYVAGPAQITWENNTTVLFPTDPDFAGHRQLVRCNLAQQ
ncbi:MAG: hypothetical protein ABWX96_03120, partial [Propionibacteriaceae bacterium]